MKKKFLISLALVVTLIFGYNLFIYVTNRINSKIAANLKGEIYYTKRVNDVLTLFKSDANLQNEKLIYSHKGQSNDIYGGYNNNIIDFYYDGKTKTVSFIAMNNGDFSLFSLKDGEEKPTIVHKEDNMTTTDYIKNENSNITITEKNGSIYETINGEEKCIKKFYGVYDSESTGFRPKGLSPDGKYLIYFSFDHLTAFGVLAEGIITGSCGHNYIMDMNTGKSTRFINAYNIQWVMN
ncbi:MAG: hypothetical protein ACM3X7_05660 [Solirubrobacterales bacterium]